MWIARNPIGGMALTKSPNGIARTPFLPVEPACCADPVPDDAAEDEDHPDENDEVRGVLAGREAGHDGVVELGDERVHDEVEGEADDDRQRAELREGWDGRLGARRGSHAGHRANALGNWATMPSLSMSAISRISAWTLSYAAMSSA